MFTPVVQLLLICLIHTIWGCQDSDNIRARKTTCYLEKLQHLKSTELYKEVMTAFADTFNVLKTKKEYFGVPEVVENTIDESVFFKKDSSECMLIVLKRNNVGLVFGNARMVRGKRMNNRWFFDVSLEYVFERSYYQLYQDNSFKNIAQLARYNVLTDGDVSGKGCEIDDNYWFKELER